MVMSVNRAESLSMRSRREPMTHVRSLVLTGYIVHDLWQIRPPAYRDKDDITPEIFAIFYTVRDRCAQSVTGLPWIFTFGPFA
jgi:hypothetical protein